MMDSPGAAGGAKSWLYFYGSSPPCLCFGAFSLGKLQDEDLVMKFREAGPVLKLWRETVGEGKGS